MLDVEYAVIGALAVAHNNYEIVLASGVTPECFQDTYARKVYEVALSLAADKKCDAFMLTETLRVSGDIEFNFEFINECVDKAPYTEDKCAEVCSMLVRASIRASGSALLAGAIDTLATSENPVSVLTDVSTSIDDVIARREEEVDKHDYVDNEIMAKMGQRGELTSYLQSLNYVINYDGLVILAGRPSDGKTSHAMKEVEHWVCDLGRHVDVFSLEMSRGDLMLRIASSRTGISMFKLKKGHATDEEKARIAEELHRIADWPLHIHDGPHTIDDIAAKALAGRAKRDTAAVVIDYLQLIAARPFEQGQSGNVIVGGASTASKHLSNRMGVPVLLLSQLSRSGARNKDVTPPLPTLEALRDSGQIEQDADAVIFIAKKPGLVCELFSGDADWESVFDVAKQRNGPLGTFDAQFVRRQFCFAEV